MSFATRNNPIHEPRTPSPERSQRKASPAAAMGDLRTWLRLQETNVSRHVAALHPFKAGEFGTAAAAPTEGHLNAVNQLIRALREKMVPVISRLSGAVQSAQATPLKQTLRQVTRNTETAHNWVRRIEMIWDFYFELFGQRQSRFGDWLLSCDRISLDCYQVAFLGLGKARSIPAPPPFSYMRTGFSPATFRRGIPLRRLGQSLNPFPLVQLPYHRLVNPWTLGAILHEVSHNLQNELGLAQVIPHAIARRLLAEGLPPAVVAVWRNWNREIFADLSGLLLGGPAVVGSLMDVVGRSTTATMAYTPGAVHPTPYLRTLLSIELLRRMNFDDIARQYCDTWTRLYPNPRSGTIPEQLLKTAEQAMAIVVDTICYQRYPQLGSKSLAEVLNFSPKEQQIIEEAAGRLAVGNDPGVVPERFLIGAARLALERRLARPGVITQNFYRELARR